MEAIYTQISNPAEARVRKVGVALSRPVLEKVYGLSIGSEVEIDYSNPPVITIKPVQKEEKGKKS